ncbi:MAG: 4-(cytidine 5'-diphospho)-2-C-methyl-D-erythritol kinase [Clostridiales Family XIII bacterium]|jgi:4-diphosphocytidyl-2-C-methyl-D-erythritol kinase|nr:4-(cytidine 5'-diphospho)-2-C-methyl-D-erythritol kinase [Clostridiales Family XIII bacterium]
MKAPAKINLFLRVLSGRSDGHHDIESVMQAIDLCDEVDVETEARTPSMSSVLITQTFEIICKTEGADLPEDENNLAVRAAQAFLDQYEHNLQSLTVNIRIRKRIPLAAGLAGGSADAAAVLLALAAAHAPDASLTELANLGVTLGADIPFQLYACAKANPEFGYADEAFGTAVAGGIGEQLLPVRPAKKAYILLVNPGTFVSAAEAYHLFDSQYEIRQNEPQPQGGKAAGIEPKTLFAALTSGEEKAILSGLSNDLLPPVAATHPEVKGLLSKMATLCAVHGGRAMMSGSGPTVYGLFFREPDARATHAEVQDVFPQMFHALAKTI